jgi:hypothetical protein
MEYETPSPEEVPYLVEIEFDVYDPEKLVALLYRRGRLQSAVMDVFAQLVLRGLVSATSVSSGILLEHATENVQKLLHVMMSVFLLLRQSSERAGFELPVLWLCVVLCRSATNMDHVFGTIVQSG